MHRTSAAPEAPATAGARTTHGTVRDVLISEHESALTRYRRLTIADAGVGRFVLFEVATMFLLPMPGAAGLLLRRKLLRRFFGACGRNVVIGRNCVFRQPQRIFLGDSVVIDDNCLLDARGCGSEGMQIGDETIVSRDCSIKSKAGGVRIGRRVNIGGGAHLVSHGGITIGDHAAIGAACQINGGTFALEDFAKPPTERTPVSNGPIEIGAGVWLATNVVVLDAVRIGDGSVVSAGSVVAQAVEPHCVAQGNPAKKVFTIR
ncbi:MAG TPA: acyltransferase [Vicinamibacterales bacterium]|jgi:acetyltransferase-like isoleucine patch superfamily enzyme|nr:acyltransferase [Vicinamibacterales bacterium]